MDAAAGAAAVAVRGAEEITFGAPFVGEDIEAVTSFPVRAYGEGTRRVLGQKDYGRYNCSNSTGRAARGRTVAEHLPAVVGKLEPLPMAKSGCH